MAAPIKDVEITDKYPSKLLLDKHCEFICSYGKKKDEYEYCITEYLRLSGIYWGLTALDLMGQIDKLDKDSILEFLKSCHHKCGGFSSSTGHDPHMLHTLSAVQILVMYDALDSIEVDKIVEYVKKLQQDDGSFYGDKWGEVDTRFTFCAVATLALLNRLDAIDVEKAVAFVLKCMNYDGGFGCRPGSETHSGQVYCCLGTLSITHQLHHVNADLLGRWLCERQLPSGGLNGRPEKLPDVCYSWWVLASLKIIDRLHWVDKEFCMKIKVNVKAFGVLAKPFYVGGVSANHSSNCAAILIATLQKVCTNLDHGLQHAIVNKLVRFILASQDEETGGFSDRPGDMVDPFHTVFGIAGLSLLGEQKIKEVNPVFCMSQKVIKRAGVSVQLLKM